MTYRPLPPSRCRACNFSDGLIFVRCRMCGEWVNEK